MFFIVCHHPRTIYYFSLIMTGCQRRPTMAINDKILVFKSQWGRGERLVFERTCYFINSTILSKNPTKAGLSYPIWNPHGLILRNLCFCTDSHPGFPSFAESTKRLCMRRKPRAPGHAKRDQWASAKGWLRRRRRNVKEAMAKNNETIPQNDDVAKVAKSMWTEKHQKEQDRNKVQERKRRTLNSNVNSIWWLTFSWGCQAAILHNTYHHQVMWWAKVFKPSSRVSFYLIASDFLKKLLHMMLMPKKGGKSISKILRTVPSLVSSLNSFLEHPLRVSLTCDFKVHYQTMTT